MDIIVTLVKYGPLGVAVALALLSFYLLSKEQKQVNARDNILKSIKNYMIFAISLSIIFGSIELVLRTALRNDAEDAINQMWSLRFQNENDTTLVLKTDRLKNYLQQDLSENVETSVVCAEFITELETCEERLESVDQGFYSNIIKLKQALNTDGDEWINVEYNPTDKTEFYKLLEQILISLDELSETGNEDQVMIEKWKNLKRKWSAEDFKYMFYSDIPQIVRVYLDKFYPKTPIVAST